MKSIVSITIAWLLLSLGAVLAHKVASGSVVASQQITETLLQNSDSLKSDSAYQTNRKDSLEEIVPYLDRVENESGTTLIIIYFLLIVLTSFMSEDLACIGAGLMAAQGLLEFWPAASAALTGIFVGDYGLYFAGRILGDSVFRTRPLSWIISEDTLESSTKWFENKGPIIMVISRFVPGSRLPVYLSAGMLKTGFWTFTLYFGVTAALWTPVFVWLSVIAGHEILAYYDRYDQYAIWVMLAIVVVLYLMYKYLLPLFTVRGRRIAWQKIKQILGK